MVHKPFGLFMALAWSRRTSQRMKIALITLGGLMLSLCMEYLQSYLPARVSTLSATLFNAVGTCSGAVLGHTLAARTFTGTHIRRLRQRLIMDGALVDLGLIVMGVWTLSHLAPQVPSHGPGPHVL